MVFQAVARVANENEFHPVRDYLRSLVWDGEPRLDLWLFTYVGASDLKDKGERDERLVDYTKAIGPRFLISAVARVMRPGCKADCALILEGDQGIRKSSALRAIFGDHWFMDDLTDIRNKDALQQIQGKWGVEFAELDSLKHSDAAKVKAFLSRTTDRFRAPYGRAVADHPRQCIFCGTVNEWTWHDDHTGARRFWPIKSSGVIDVERLLADRDQFWAEAVARFDCDDPWWLEAANLVSVAKEEQSKRLYSDAVGDEIEEWLTRNGVRDTSVPELLSGALGITDKAKWTRSLQTRIGAHLRSTRWSSYRRREGSTRGRRYRRTLPDMA